MSSFGRESVVPSSNQHSDPALAPPSTMPRSQAWRSTPSIPCARQIACWFRVFPPDTTMASTERKTSSQLRDWRVLAMKLSCMEGSTSRGAQLRKKLIVPVAESADAVGRKQIFGRGLPVSCAM